MKNKPDCYECKYRGEVPGSAHSSCNHPEFQTVKDNPTLKLTSILSRGNMPQFKSKKIKVKGNQIGIRGGWFSHPFNFDPVWLEECNGFKNKEE